MNFCFSYTMKPTFLRDFTSHLRKKLSLEQIFEAYGLSPNLLWDHPSPDCWSSDFNPNLFQSWTFLNPDFLLYNQSVLGVMTQDTNFLFDAGLEALSYDHSTDLFYMYSVTSCSVDKTLNSKNIAKIVMLYCKEVLKQDVPQDYISEAIVFDALFLYGKGTVWDIVITNDSLLKFNKKNSYKLFDTLLSSSTDTTSIIDVFTGLCLGTGSDVYKQACISVWPEAVHTILLSKPQASKYFKTNKNQFKKELLQFKGGSTLYWNSIQMGNYDYISRLLQQEFTYNILKAISKHKRYRSLLSKVSYKILQYVGFNKSFMSYLTHQFKLKV